MPPRAGKFDPRRGPPTRDFRAPVGTGAPRRDFKSPAGPPKSRSFDARGPAKPRDESRAPAPRPAARAPKPAPKATGTQEGIRLQSMMARAGIASRREAETIILEGRVTLNGEVVTQLGTRAVPGRDHVKVDGKLLQNEERKVYFLFNKPRGVITAVTDPHGRPVVVDYLKVRERIFPVGRLDWDTEGLLVLTNDGDLAYKLTHPKFEIPRTYQAKVRGVPVEKTLERLRRGVTLDDGKARVATIRLLESTGTNAWLEVIVQEGRNRLVRRILEAVGHPVSKLKRVSFAGLELGNLKPGQSRALGEFELLKLKKELEDATPEEAAPRRDARFAPPPKGFRPGDPLPKKAKPVRAAAEEGDDDEDADDDEESVDSSSEE